MDAARCPSCSSVRKCDSAITGLAACDSNACHAGEEETRGAWEAIEGEGRDQRRDGVLCADGKRERSEQDPSERRSADGRARGHGRGGLASGRPFVLLETSALLCCASLATLLCCRASSDLHRSTLATFPHAER